MIQQERSAVRDNGPLETDDLLDLIQDAVIARQTDGAIVLWNRAAELLYGWTAPEALGRHTDELLGNDPPEIALLITAALQTSGIWEGQLIRRRRDGGAVTVRARITRRRNLLLESGHDETERLRGASEARRLLEDALSHAHRDPLTSLLNRRAFFRRLDAAEERIRRASGPPFAVVLMDLDNFKFFNDAYGHVAGDDVLDQVSQALSDTGTADSAIKRSGNRSLDVILARLGGDEFAALLIGAHLKDARDWIHLVKDAVARIAFHPPGHKHPIPIALSAGAACVPDESPTTSTAIGLADERLYRDKRDSRDFWSGILRSHLSETLAGFGTLDAVLLAVDGKDRYTLRHSEDALIHALRIGQGMDLSREALEWLQVAALLHDIGKIGVPDRLLRMPGPLEPDEMAIMREHATVGAALVGAMPALATVAPTVRHHHERWDGEGYPDGLHGEAIPLPARILAVADAFSAMTTDRPYRRGVRPAQALAALQAGAGKQWDPACVAVFNGRIE